MARSLSKIGFLLTLGRSFNYIMHLELGLNVNGAEVGQKGCRLDAVRHKKKPKRAIRSQKQRQ